MYWVNKVTCNLLSIQVTIWFLMQLWLTCCCQMFSTYGGMPLFYNHDIYIYVFLNTYMSYSYSRNVYFVSLCTYANISRILELHLYLDLGTLHMKHDIGPAWIWDSICILLYSPKSCNLCCYLCIWLCKKHIWYMYHINKCKYLFIKLF